MVCYYFFSSAASANTLDGSPVHSIIWIQHIHVAGGVSGPATMVVAFVPVLCVVAVATQTQAHSRCPDPPHEY